MFLLLFIGSPSDLYDKTNPDWAPTQNMGHDKLKNTKVATERSARAKERGVKRKIAEATQAFEEPGEEPSDDQLDDEPEHQIIDPPSPLHGKQMNIRLTLFITVEIRLQIKFIDLN